MMEVLMNWLVNTTIDDHIRWTGEYRSTYELEIGKRWVVSDIGCFKA